MNLRISGMWLLLLAFSFFSLTIQAATPTPRIVGGTVVPDDRYPFMVSVYFDLDGDRSFNPGCGGSLINRNWVLTAAHCVVDAETGNVLPVRALSVLYDVLDLTDPDQGTLVGVNRVVVHPGYSIPTFVADIALLELARPADEPVITLPAAGGNVPTIGESAVVAGWGRTSENGASSGPLLEVSLPVIAHGQCLPFYSDTLQSDANVCAGGAAAGGRDSCQGDSGGPLFVVRNNVYVQAGIVSYGEGCARPNIPGVYTRVSNYTAWIESIVPGVQVSSSGVGSSEGDQGANELTPTVLSASNPIQRGSLQTGEVTAYEVTGALRVELRSLTGDADLTIFRGVELNREDRVCISELVTNIDACDIPASTQRHFALVLGYRASQYEISVQVPSNDGLAPLPDNSGDSDPVFTGDDPIDLDAPINTDDSLSVGGSSGGGGGVTAPAGILILAALVLGRRRKALLHHGHTR